MKSVHEHARLVYQAMHNAETAQYKTASEAAECYAFDLIRERDSEHAAALAIAEERYRVLEEAITVARAAMMHPLDEWKGQVERTALDVTRAALEGK